jgi:hypothetical protein
MGEGDCINGRRANRDRARAKGEEAEECEDKSGLPAFCGVNTNTNNTLMTGLELTCRFDRI